MSISATTTMKGRLLTGDIDGPITKAFDHASDAMGQYLVRKIRDRLSTVLVNPTGHYKAKIDYTNLTQGLVVHDSGVVYGPWLEGVSSRNARSRFKGYSTFRRVMQEASDNAGAIAEQDIQQLVKELS